MGWRSRRLVSVDHGALLLYCKEGLKRNIMAGGNRLIERGQSAKPDATASEPWELARLGANLTMSGGLGVGPAIVNGEGAALREGYPQW